MNPVRPPGAPSSPVALEGPAAPASAPVSAPAGASKVSPAEAVVAELRAGSIAPDEAVRRLTAHALAASHCPASLRPAVEARVRAAMARDPFVAELLGRMGASVPAEE